jgi:hypothetical protein
MRKGFVTLLAIGGCGGGTADPPTAAAEVELVEIARFDGGPEGFGRITDLVIGEEGTVYVLDGLNRVVYAFGAGGALPGRFGGRGGGPGELEQPTALFRGPDGNLWVVDAGNARFTVFEPGGGLVGSYPSADPQLMHPLAIGTSGAGHLLTVALAFGRLEAPEAVLLESALEGGELRTVRQSALPFVSWSPPFAQQGDGMLLVVPVPFSPEPAFQVDAEGRLWYASGSDPWVHRWAPDHGIERSWGRTADALPVTAAERRAALEAPDFAEFRAAAGPAGIAALTAQIPATKPHVRGFFVGDDGTVWIMRPAHADADGSPPPLDVYDAAGAHIGVARVELEAEPRPHLRGGLLAGVVRDEFGVETVVVYRLPPRRAWSLRAIAVEQEPRPRHHGARRAARSVVQHQRLSVSLRFASPVRSTSARSRRRSASTRSVSWTWCFLTTISSLGTVLFCTTTSSSVSGTRTSSSVMRAFAWRASLGSSGRRSTVAVSRVTGTSRLTCSVSTCLPTRTSPAD